MFKFAASLILLLQALITSLQVHVMDTNDQPQADVTVRLELYDFASEEYETTATVAFTGHCTTNASGDCEIEIGETNGVLRGRLDVEGYGSRDVIWPGGRLQIPVRLEQVNPGTEAQPYDFQEENGGVLLRTSFPWVSVICVAVLVGGLALAIYFRARKEHI